MRRFILGLILLVVVALLALNMPFSSAETPQVVKTFRSPGNRRLQKRVGNRQVAAASMARLEPLHAPLEEPGPNDWLAQHEETGQTFDQYADIQPVTPSGRRSVIYVQPLGDFTPEQRTIVELSAEYLGLYMTRTVRILDDLPLSTVPSSARRDALVVRPEQILTSYVLYDVLKPRLPEDAASYIAFTATDLWPGKGWNFVYGQASYRDRVGVWSLARNGDPAGGDEAFRLCLLRTLKTASHEVGHTFSMKHCTEWQCNMNGRNHMEEKDRSPLWLCPECHAKLVLATNTPAMGRFQRLRDFCERHGLAEEQAYFESAAAALARRSSAGE